MNMYFTPAEIKHLVQLILAMVDQQSMPPAELTTLEQTLATFTERWQTCFTRFGQQPAGELAYRDALLYFQEVAAPLARLWLAADGPGQEAVIAIETMLMTPPPPRRFNRQVLAQMRQLRRLEDLQPQDVQCPKLDRPIFIVSAPRAGSTLLFVMLAQFPEIWTIGRECHDLEVDIPATHPATRNYASNRLTAAEATPTIKQLVRRWFSQRLQDRSGCLYWALPEGKRRSSVRFLEKTPQNALRIPFLKAIFPEAKFIFLYREPRQNITSLLEGWRSRRFVAYREMPGWPYKEWSFLLIPGWEWLIDRPLVEIAAQQWRGVNEQIRADLPALPKSDWLFVTYQDLTERPAETIREISRFAGLRWDAVVEQTVAGRLPLSRLVISSTSNKWWEQAGEIDPILSVVQPVAEQVEALVSL